MKKTQFNVGDKVRYRTEFLRSIGCYSGPLPFARGEITAVKTHGTSFTLATINWTKGDAPETVNVFNLERCK
jgi:hypothetical protein